MKKKMMLKILGIVMAVMLFAMAPLFLTACGAANITAVAKAAAKDYFRNHVDYLNFVDTTYVYETNSVEKYKNTVEYKENIEDEMLLIDNFDSVEITNTVYKIQVVNTNDLKLALVIDINRTETEKGYEADGVTHLLKEIDYVANRHTVYKLSYIKEGADTTYYLTKRFEKKEGEEIVQTDRYYRVYANENAYIEAFNNVLDDINDDMIETGYFEYASSIMLQLYANLLHTEVFGNDAKIKMNYESFYINNGVYDLKSSMEIGFKNNKLGQIKAYLKTSNNDSSSEISTKFHVEFKAEDVDTQVVLTGATLNTSLMINDSDIPQVETMLFS